MRLRSRLDKMEDRTQATASPSAVSAERKALADVTPAELARMYADLSPAPNAAQDARLDGLTLHELAALYFSL